MVGSPAGQPYRLNEADYLPGVNHHAERARTAMDQGQWEVASAHTELLLHSQGLRVFVDTSQMPVSLTEIGKAASARAVEYWNGVVGPKSLTLVDTPAAADLTIQFNKEIVLRGIQVGGYASQSRSVTVGGDGSASPDYQATIYARYQLPNGNLLNEAAMLNVVAHEIGHIYGLNDSTEGSHLMSPLNPNRTKLELHPDELEALKNLRLTLFEMQRDIAAKSRAVRL